MNTRGEADARDHAVRERSRNVIVDASAGTGKTTFVVDRIVELVAPGAGQIVIPIDRLAAITFTRKAAAELRTRTRQRVRDELAAEPPGSPRAAQLRHARDGLDTAAIGTIHGFADQLLRQWPARAGLDPRYQLDEDDAALARACCDLLVDAAEAGTLADVLRGSDVVARAEEATATIGELLRAGLRVRSKATEHWTYHGLDSLIIEMVRQRDIAVAEPEARELDAAELARFAAEYLQLVSDLSPGTLGGRWLVHAAGSIRAALAAPAPADRYWLLVELLERGPLGRASDEPQKARDFGDDDRAWDAWRAFAGDPRKHPVRARALRDDLLRPLRRWLALRVARLRPVILHLYRLIKAQRGVVDHLDLLVSLRDVLRDDRAIRRSCQQRYDHVLVDEVQDTDPLQAEIVLFLCEQDTAASDWDTVTVAPGKLTVVGDPKQSIYRFRRADIDVYRRMLAVIERGPHLALQLSASFRSAPRLVTWLNERFATILGEAPDGRRFDPATGEVFHRPLAPGRAAGPALTVHAVPFELPSTGDADTARRLEAATMARYLRWLVHHAAIEVVDPMTGTLRALGYGDLAVLAITTTNLPLLFGALDRDDVPYAARGGTLFLKDPLHRRFLLGLAAIADRDDGVACAAVLRPPFFALDLGDLARAGAPDDPVAQARAILRDLRRRRFERSVGGTARALLETTGLGRTVALGPNGPQRLAGLRELCFQVEALAATEQLDFDAAIARVRTWIDAPPIRDRPLPVSGNAVRVMTVHQAKGLESPVVVLWDGLATWRERPSYAAWTADRAGRGWAIRLDRLTWEEPAGAQIARRELAMREAERKRIVYVAATRARDLIVVPKPIPGEPRAICASLLAAPSAAVVERERHAEIRHARWFDAAAPVDRRAQPEITDRDVALAATWQARAREAGRAVHRPGSFSAGLSRPWDVVARHGAEFGALVHAAIGIALTRGGAPADAVAIAIERGTPGRRHHHEAADDVERALAALRPLGVVPGAETYHLEYPIAGPSRDGRLLAGYIDLVARCDDQLVVIDFKTELPRPDEPIPTPYVDQVGGYARALATALGVASCRAGLLFTASGAVRWLPGDLTSLQAP